MKNFKFLFLFLLACTAGCIHSQAPVSPAPTVALTWTAPTNCAGCSYIVSRTTCTGSTQNTCGSSFTPLQTTSSAVSGTVFTDSAPPTGFVSYIVQAVTGTPAITGSPSTPVNNSVPLNIPIYPGIPTGIGGTTIAMLSPPLVQPTSTEPQLAMSHTYQIGNLQAKIIYHK